MPPRSDKGNVLYPPCPVYQDEAALEEALAEHEDWVMNGGLRGRRLILRNVALRDPDSLKHAKHRFSREDWKNRQLQGARFENVTLWDTDLSGTDLTAAEGLLPEHLSGCVLTNTKLPATIGDFSAILDQVGELSRNTGKLFLTLVGASIFLLLTIWNMDVSQLSLDSGVSVKLPVVDVEAPLHLVFLLGPIILYCLFLSLHLYVHRLWRQIAMLPAVFPDGIPLDRKTYPWLLNDIVCSRFPRLRERRDPLVWTQWALSGWTIYVILLPVLLAFWARYLCRHDLRFSLIHVGILTLYLWSAFLYRYMGQITLDRDTEALQNAVHWWDFGQNRKVLVPLLAVTSAVGLVFSAVTIQTMARMNPAALEPRLTALSEMIHPAPPKPKHLKEISLLTPLFPLHTGGGTPDIPRRYRSGFPATETEDETLRQEYMPRWMEWIGLGTRADLSGRELSAKPDRWMTPVVPPWKLAAALDPESETLDTEVAAFRQSITDQIHKPARLSRRSLSFASADHCFAAAGVLEETHLELADLRGAVLTAALLRGAHLWRADLREADLRGADLRGADLCGAHLEDARLDGADLSGAYLEQTGWADARAPAIDVHGARLWAANLRGADLRGMRNLIYADLTFARIDADTQLLPQQRAELKSSYFLRRVNDAEPYDVLLPRGWSSPVSKWHPTADMQREGFPTPEYVAKIQQQLRTERK